MRRSPQSAFTLIELMVVVAVLSIIASIAIPKFANMLVKTRESVVKSSLGALRSALSIYYSDNEGYFPGVGDLAAALSSGGRYIKEIPPSQIPAPANHPSTASVTDFAGAYTDLGDWMYFVSSGAITVNCTHLDSVGRVWNTN